MQLNNHLLEKQVSSNISLEKSSNKNESNDFDLKSLLQNYLDCESKYKYEYEYFLSVIKAKQSDKEFIDKLLDQLRASVNILEPRVFETKLISLIFFDIKWHSHYLNDREILNKLSDFLIDLNSAYTNYINKCLTFLIKLFAIAPEANNDCENLYEFSHNIINQLIKLAPTYKTNIYKLFDSLYPYMIKDTAIQDAYIKNLLKLANTFKEIRLPLLEVCIQKMLKIDVNSVASQIIEAELNKETPDADDKIEVDEENTNGNKVNIPMKHPFADRLDVKMNNLLKFIQNICISPQTEQFDLEACKLLFKDLLFIFDKYLINTYGSSHVQFAMFYICSFKPMFSEAFIDYLWKKFCNVNTCAITRQICAYYIGSLLARAKYIPIQTCVATLQLMVTWLHNYIEKSSSSTSSQASTINLIDLHRTFYSLCQTVFYVIIFRNRQLFQQQQHQHQPNNQHNKTQNDLSNLVRSWKLNEIVTSKLNPLRYCLRSIRKKFARIAYINQIAYCYSILDANNRMTIPISGANKQNAMFFSSQSDVLFLSKNNSNTSTYKAENTTDVANNPLDSFFPFDPYLLSRSKCFIEKIYQEFQNVIDDDMDLDDSDDSDDSESDENEEEEEDDDEDDEEDGDNEEDDKINYDLQKELEDENISSDDEKDNKKHILKLNIRSSFHQNNNSNLTFSNDDDYYDD